MLPEPLHPAIVHFPVALAVLLPALALAAAWAVSSGRLPRSIWAAVAALQVLLGVAAWCAAETGRRQEDVVERVVAERHIETHEEAAERFRWLQGGAMVIALLGLLAGRPGELARWASCVATIGVLAAVFPVGRSGGALVYEHGAATAYARSATTAHAVPNPLGDSQDDDENDGDGDD